MSVHRIAIKLDRVKRIYHQGESIGGVVLIDNKRELKHNGIQLTMDGIVELNTNLKSINLMDTFASSSKVIRLVDFTYELAGPGRMCPGKTKVPFNILIDGSVDTPTLYETYHGVFISIQYLLKCRVKRSFFQRDQIETIEFFIEYEPSPIGCRPATAASSAALLYETFATTLVKQPFKFEITPDSLNAAATVAAARRELIPGFRLTGQLDSLIWRLSEPITGEFVIKHCDAVIRSIELQLVRVETCSSTSDDVDGCSGQNLDVCMTNNDLQRQQQQQLQKQIAELIGSRDSTEVQNIQIGDGDLLRNVPISIHMVLPRLFTCPTLITNRFRIEFEINLVIIFDDNYLITENFPIKLVRSSL